MERLKAILCTECKYAEDSYQFEYCFKIHAYVPEGFGCIIGEKKEKHSEAALAEKGKNNG